MLERSKGGDRRLLAVIVALALLILSLFLLSLWAGRYRVPLAEVISYCLGRPVSQTVSNVIGRLRIPRALCAALIGCSLSVSGAIYQALFNNRLVSPDILGVSSGAGVGACLAILLGVGGFGLGLSSFAFGFATVAATIGLAAAFRGKDTVVLILAGLAIGGLMSSCIGLLKYLADDEMKLSEMTFWLLGRLSDVTYSEVFLLLPVAFLGTVFSLIFSFRLNILSLGRRESRALGVRYPLLFGAFLLVATVLTATSVCVAGTIGWIGLVIPNLARLLFGSDNRKVLPFSALSGAAFLMACDILARSISPNEIPLGVVTGIFGTPLFVLVLLFRRKESL